MTWNYRVMKRKNLLGDFEFGIHEVYYDEKQQVSAWSENPVTPPGTSEEELLSDLTAMMEAFRKGTLDYDKDQNDELPP